MYPEIGHDFNIRNIFLTDFLMHSLAILMHRHAVIENVTAFIADVAIGSWVKVLLLRSVDWTHIAVVFSSLRLDIADAYQYVAAEINGLKLVSLDKDFDRTTSGRLTPEAALQLFMDEQRKHA